MASQNNRHRLPQPRTAYCKRCDDNTMQWKGIHSKLGKWMDRICCGLPSRLDFGSWLCLACGRRNLVYEPPFDDEPVLDSLPAQVLEIRRIPVMNRDDDLVARIARLERYSDKFRESILVRLLSGQVDARTLRNELNLSEFDLLWMMQEKIRRLEEKLEMLESKPPAFDNCDQNIGDPSSPPRAPKAIPVRARQP